MDSFTTKFEVLKTEDRKVTGIKVTAAGTTEDEYFCGMLPRNLQRGRASFTATDRKIFIRSVGIGGEEEWNFSLSEDEESQLQTILSGLGETYQGHCKTEGGFGVSFIVSFKEIPLLNKRERNKRKRSIWRNPTAPRNKEKRKAWERIYT